MWWAHSAAFLRGGQAGPCESSSPMSPHEIGCKVARLHRIHSVTSHRWCQITPLTQSCIMSSGILGPQMQMWPPHWSPQTAAARNAPGHMKDDKKLTHVMNAVAGISCVPNIRLGFDRADGKKGERR